MISWDYLFGHEYELLCDRCVKADGTRVFAIYYTYVVCIPCLTECILKNRKILRSYGVT